MKAIITAICIVMALGTSCGTTLKIVPEHKGVDPRVENLVREFKWLAKQRKITFYNEVTIGFKKINRDNVIGSCTFGGMWREIDLDIDFWNNSTSTAKLALVFHELTHCYCKRYHDYRDFQQYPETATGRLAQAIRWKITGGERPGFYDDGCPVSLMYPIVVDSDCVIIHYPDYVSEMFDRCKPY